MTTSLAWYRGIWDHPEHLRVPLDDRGLNLADGVFETVLMHNGKPLLLDRHLQRMARGCELLQLGPAPAADFVITLAAEGYRRLDAGGRQAALRITLSRGSGRRGLAVPASQSPRLWLQLNTLQPDFSSVALVTSRLVTSHGNSASSRCKTLSYTNAVIARQEATAAGADDALILSVSGHCSSATAANLWVHQGDQWLTPAVAEGCLPGVMRSVLLQRPMAIEARVPPALVQSAGGVLLNSLGCRPVSSIDGRTPQRQLGSDAAEALFEALLREGSAELADVGKEEGRPGGEEEESHGSG